MPSLSPKSATLQQSPIRKLAPLARAAESRGTEVIYLNIGQPDMPTPPEMIAELHGLTLATLAYDGRRGAFFRRELLDALTILDEGHIDRERMLGSWSGAMGQPQFMPSSFRAYAVDATGDGKRDIWNNWADVAGSVANYFIEHGWRSGEDVVAQATLGHAWSGAKPEPRNTLTPSETVKSLSAMGVLFATDLPADSKVELLAYDGDDGREHWVGFHNFFVITKYNRSVMYALAAHQLGQAIAGKVAESEG